jgi:hypothetical protein
MDCQIIHLIFSRKKYNQDSSEREAQVKAIFEFSKLKGISFDFNSEICHHPKRSCIIQWREIPILRIKCFGDQSDLHVLNHKQDILLHLIQPMIYVPDVRYISFLVDFRLPGWNSFQESILTLNRAGGFFLHPTQINLSSSELKKLKRRLNIEVMKILEQKNDITLLDAINPNHFSFTDFRILI